MSDAMHLESRRRLDNIVHLVCAALQDTHFYYDPTLGIVGSLAAIVQRECQEAGLRVSRRDVFKRVEDFVFGGGDDEESPCSVN
jgi:hypothetical protein